MRLSAISLFGGDPATHSVEDQEVWLDGMAIRQDDQRVLVVADDRIGEIRFVPRLAGWRPGHWTFEAVSFVMDAHFQGRNVVRLARGRVWIRPGPKTFPARF